MLALPYAYTVEQDAIAALNRLEPEAMRIRLLEVKGLAD